MITVVELRVYIKQAEKLLTKDERHELISHIALNPTCGVVIQGTGGIRKLRWRRSGTGKSGGARIIYFYHNDSIPLFMLSIFGKASKENLSQKERNDLAKLTRILRDQYGEK